MSLIAIYLDFHKYVIVNISLIYCSFITQTTFPVYRVGWFFIQSIHYVFLNVHLLMCVVHMQSTFTIRAFYA